MRSSLAPSMRAASMISSGTESSACRTRNVPSALAPKGRISAPKVFTRPTRPSMVNTGTNVICAGMSRQASTSPNAPRLPDEAQLGERIAGGQRQGDLEERDGERHHHRVDEVAADGHRLEHLAVSAELERRRERIRRRGDDLGQRAQRGERHPRVGPEPEQRHHHQDAAWRAARAPRSPRSITRPPAASRGRAGRPRAAAP